MVGLILRNVSGGQLVMINVSVGTVKFWGRFGSDWITDWIWIIMYVYGSPNPVPTIMEVYACSPTSDLLEGQPWFTSHWFIVYILYIHPALWSLAGWPRESLGFSIPIHKYTNGRRPAGHLCSPFHGLAYIINPYPSSYNAAATFFSGVHVASSISFTVSSTLPPPPTISPSVCLLESR